MPVTEGTPIYPPSRSRSNHFLNDQRILYFFASVFKFFYKSVSGRFAAFGPEQESRLNSEPLPKH